MKKSVLFAALAAVTCSIAIAGEAVNGLNSGVGSAAVEKAAVLPVPVASAVLKTSMIRGPWVAKTVGKNTCTVLPSSVIKITEAEKTVTAIRPALDVNELETLIKAAGNEPVSVSGLHIVETIPPVKISAGIFPATPSIDLYVDSSDIRRRKGAASSKLTGLVGKYCGRF
jgi:hypothetical protein